MSIATAQKRLVMEASEGLARITLTHPPLNVIDFQMMDELARAGAAILMVSSEMGELLQVADRILVMRQGRISGELPGRTTQEAIMRCAAFEISAVTAEEHPE